jgi:CheY-like chemotaxis protein
MGRANSSGIIMTYPIVDASGAPAVAGPAVGGQITAVETINRAAAELQRADGMMMSASDTPSIKSGDRDNKSAASGKQQSDAGQTTTVTHASSTGDSRRKLHILAVDDDGVNRTLVARMLKRVGCTCDLLEDGDQVEERLVATGQLQPQPGSPPVAGSGGFMPYDAILMDIVMVRSDGAMVTHALKTRGLTVPVFAMTANHQPSDLAKYKIAGMEPLVRYTTRTVRW